MNTKLKMTHSPKHEQHAHLDMEMRAKLRGIFNNHIYPIVMHEFGWLYEPVETWLDKHNVKLFARFVSGVTAGKLFWPRSHTDPDVWYTVLVCIDYGKGIKCGGDFGFGSIGHVLQCTHGDVLVYNPTHHHGTTEFSLIPNDEKSGRIFFAFYMKKQIVHADLLTQQVVKRVGVQPLKFYDFVSTIMVHQYTNLHHRTLVRNMIPHRPLRI